MVHNGIIENFAELRLELETRGHVLKSKTDTEVIAHLIEDALKSSASSSLADAVLETVKRLEGSYSIAAISTADPESGQEERESLPR